MLNLVRPPKPNGALTREQLLQHELEKQRHLMSQLAHVLCALLKEKHGGRVFLQQSSLAETLNWNAQVQVLPELGTVRLQLSTPDGKPFLVPDKPSEGEVAPETVLPEATKPEIPPEVTPEAAPSAPCASEWHKDGIGLRCPDCGSIQRDN
jgi:hypothetical protein